MGFFSDVKFLTNLLRRHQNICEIVENTEKECKYFEEDVKSLKEILNDYKDQTYALDKRINEVYLEIEKQEKKLEIAESENYNLRKYESVEYINKLIKDKSYHMIKLDLSDEPFKAYYEGNRRCYSKVVVLRAIKFKIQEFAAKEGLCYDKLERALLDINAAWCEAYDKLDKDIPTETYTGKKLITSFMMLATKK